MLGEMSGVERQTPHDAPSLDLENGRYKDKGFGDCWLKDSKFQLDRKSVFKRSIV